jgi:hypothetical protein
MPTFGKIGVEYPQSRAEYGAGASGGTPVLSSMTIL